MNIDLNNLPDSVQFVYIAMTKTAIIMKEMGQDREFFLNFCNEIWTSMEMTDLKDLNKCLQEKMKEDLKPHIDAYIKNGYQKRTK